MFRIVSGNTDDVFKIETSLMASDEMVGELRTALELDREVQDFYQLTVSAFNRGQPQLSR